MTWTAAITVSGYVASWSESARAFRPFDGTDAAVASVGELELEFEPFGLLRQGSERTLIAPETVLDLGVAEGWEAVLQGQGETALPPALAGASLVGNKAFLQGVLRDGVLQGSVSARARKCNRTGTYGRRAAFHAPHPSTSLPEATCTAA
jgi:hypothetical protein